MEMRSLADITCGLAEMKIRLLIFDQLLTRISRTFLCDRRRRPVGMRNKNAHMHSMSKVAFQFDIELRDPKCSPINKHTLYGWKPIISKMQIRQPDRLNCKQMFCIHSLLLRSFVWAFGVAN